MESKESKMKENNIQRLIEERASQLGHRLFRNNKGALQNKQGDWVSYGVGPEGTADLLGFAVVTITPDMVGERVAVFCSVEVKKPGESPRRNQRDWMNFIRQMGGRAGVATSPEEVDAILRG